MKQWAYRVTTTMTRREWPHLVSRPYKHQKKHHSDGPNERWAAVHSCHLEPFVPKLDSLRSMRTISFRRIAILEMITRGIPSHGATRRAAGSEPTRTCRPRPRADFFNLTIVLRHRSKTPPMDLALGVRARERVRPGAPAWASPLGLKKEKKKKKKKQSSSQKGLHSLNQVPKENRIGTILFRGLRAFVRRHRNRRSDPRSCWVATPSVATIAW